MPINFPGNPSTNQVFTHGGNSWVWNGEYWKRVAASAPSVMPSLTVDGDFVVHGTTTSISSTHLVIEDNIITLNSGQTGAAALDAGIEVERGDDTNVQLRWNESDNEWEYTNDGTNFYPVTYSPVGTVVQYAGASAPAGWLMCDGSAISRTFYSRLFDVVGTTYGVGDGATTFNVPNLQGKFPVGADSLDTAFDVLGETGGAKEHTLLANEVPSHTHDLAHNHTASTNAQSNNTTGGNSANHTHNTNNTGDHTHNLGNPNANHYHGGNTGNVSAWHTHGTNADGSSLVSRINSYNKYGAYDTVNGGGYQHGGWAMGVDYGYTHAHNTGNPSANHYHGFNTGNVSSWHTHNTNNAGAHSHSMNNQSANHTHEFGHTHTLSVSAGSGTTGATGGNVAHNNLPPYLVLNYIIKV